MANDLQQQLNMQQAQSLNIGATVNNAAGSFLNSQVGGLYNSYGITPQIQQAANQYIGQPVAQMGSNSIGLVSSYFALSSRQAAAMSLERRDDASSAVAANMMSTGLTVGSGVASIGGAIGLAAIGGAPGVVLGIGGALVGAGFEAVLGSKFLASMTGSKMVGWDDSVFHPVAAAKEKLAFNNLNQAMLRNESYKFLRPGASKNPYTLGLSKGASQDWAKRINTWGNKMQLEDTEVGDLLSSSIDNGLMSNTNDIDEFEAKFAQQVKYIKNASKILNKSVTEISSMMAEYKQAGYSIDNFDLKTGELKSMSAMLGKSTNEVKDFLLGSAKSFSQGTTLSAENQGGIAGYNASVLSYAYDTAVSSGDIRTKNLITNAGGTTGAATQYRQGIDRILTRSNFSIPMAGFFDEGANGDLTFNREDYLKTVSGINNGSMRYQDIVAGSNNKMSRWSSQNKLAFMTNPGQFILEQGAQEVSGMLDIVGTALQRDKFPTGTVEDALTTIGGLDTSTAKIMETMFESNKKYGSAIGIKNTFEPMLQKNAAVSENIIAMYRSGGKWISGSVMDELINKVVITPTNNFDNKLTGNMNAKLAIANGEFMSSGNMVEPIDVTVEGQKRQRATNILIDDALLRKNNALFTDEAGNIDEYALSNYNRLFDKSRDEIGNILKKGQGFSYTRNYKDGNPVNIITPDKDFINAIISSGRFDKEGLDLEKLKTLSETQITLTDDGRATFLIEDRQKKLLDTNITNAINVSGNKYGEDLSNIQKDWDSIKNRSLDSSMSGNMTELNNRVSNVIKTAKENGDTEVTNLMGVVSSSIGGFKNVITGTSGLTAYVIGQSGLAKKALTEGSDIKIPSAYENGELTKEFIDLAVRRDRGKATIADLKNLNVYASGDGVQAAPWKSLLELSPGYIKNSHEGLTAKSAKGVLEKYMDRDNETAWGDGNSWEAMKKSGPQNTNNLYKTSSEYDTLVSEAVKNKGIIERDLKYYSSDIQKWALKLPGIKESNAIIDMISEGKSVDEMISNTDNKDIKGVLEGFKGDDRYTAYSKLQSKKAAVNENINSMVDQQAIILSQEMAVKNIAGSALSQASITLGGMTQTSTGMNKDEFQDIFGKAIKNLGTKDFKLSDLETTFKDIFGNKNLSPEQKTALIGSYKDSANTQILGLASGLSNAAASGDPEAIRNLQLLEAIRVDTNSATTPKELADSTLKLTSIMTQAMADANKDLANTRETESAIKSLPEKYDLLNEVLLKIAKKTNTTLESLSPGSSPTPTVGQPNAAVTASESPTARKGFFESISDAWKNHIVDPSYIP